jgi:hypothetical protein
MRCGRPNRSQLQTSRKLTQPTARLPPPALETDLRARIMSAGKTVRFVRSATSVASQIKVCAAQS